MTKFENVRAQESGIANVTDDGDFAGRHLFILPEIDAVRNVIKDLLAERDGPARDLSAAPVTQAIPAAALSAAVEAPTAIVVPATTVSSPVVDPVIRNISGGPVKVIPTYHGLPIESDSAKNFDGYARHAGGGDASAAPNDADEGIVAITVGGFVSGNIDFTGDTDTITVNLIAGHTYSFSLFGSGATPVSDTFLEIHAPGGATVLQDDDGGVGVYSQGTFTATVTGTYEIIASSFNNPGDPGTGGYTVHVAEATTDTVGGTIATAGTAGLGYTYGFLETSGDVDMYQVTLTAGLVYNFEVAGGADYNTDYNTVPAGELDTIITVFDSSGAVVFTNDDINFPSDISSAGGFVPQVGGSYYVQVKAYSGQTGGYVLNTTSLDPATLNPLDSIDWGGPANKVDNSDTLLIYFATAGQTYDGVTDIGGWTAYLQQQALEAFQTYSQFTNLTFAITTNSAIADFHLVTTTSTEYLAYFNPPGETNAGVGVFATNGTGWDSTGASGSMEPGGYGWITFIHEFGHGLGMAHPHDNGGGSEIMPGVTGPFGSYGIFDLNQGVYTTMSYNDGWQLNPSASATGTPVPDTLDYGYQGTPMALDVALMQIKYGTVAHNTGNTFYSLADANVAGTFYRTIWDTAGTDTINYFGSKNAHIDLTAATLDYSATGGGVVSYVEGIFGGWTIANGVLIENATGDSGNDVLLGNAAANTLTGNGGNDTFMGRGGNDEIFGGTGTNTAIFSGNRSTYVVTAIAGGYTVQDTSVADGDDGTDTIHDITFLQFKDQTVNLLDAPGNQAPTLTGLSTTLTFNENLVNTTPQLIDTDVTFADSDGNFSGGTLTVAGLLAEDRVAIRNQGTAAGQVGVSGANLTYGGVVIGTIAGGSGATLTVTFNSVATSLAVDAVIENLTYANVSNTPTAARTLTIDVHDSAGASITGLPTFSAAVSPSPFDGLNVTVGANTHASYPTFIDIDNDGRLDLLSGGQNGTILYWHNNGNNTFTSQASPITFDVGSYSSPIAIDIDNDGDLDIVAGGNTGALFTFRNNHDGSFTQLTAAANPFNGIDVGSFSSAGAVDYDNDGLMDLVVGMGGATAVNGTIATFHHNANGTFTQVTGAANPFNGIDAGSYSNPAFFDYDNDGDQDALVGNFAGQVLAYTNNNGTFTAAPAFNNFVGGSRPDGSTPQLSFVDIDGDGDLDAVAGDYDGTFRFYRNNATHGAQVTINVTAQNDAPSGTNGSATFNQDTSYVLTAASFGFSDLDGNAFAAVSITSFPTNGTLYLDTDGPGGAAPVNLSTIGSGVFVSIADITAGHLYYTPATGASGTNYASFAFKVQDNGGIANGGVDLDPTANTFTFNVAATNSAPTLTGVNATVSFTAPVSGALIDGDVTFNDAEGNFNGGTVTVAGAVAGDTIGVRNQGNAAGQIGVSGANVSYGGVVIGTIAGGVGATLTITLNAAATSVAVDHLIENLTFSNATGATADRTLTIDVHDAGGLHIVSPPSFTFVDPSAFSTFSVAVGANDKGSYPTFVDVDNDGHLDLLSGGQNGTILYWHNNGNNTFTSQTSPITADVGSYSSPVAIDIDNDGDLDIVAGGNTGQLFTFRNNHNGTFTQLTGAGVNPFDGIDVGSFSSAGAVDYDKDGLVDLVVGIGGATTANGTLATFHHNANGTFTQVTGAANPFNGIDVGSYPNPSFFDYDGDGDMDALIGNFAGQLLAYRNDGGVFVADAAYDNIVGGGTLGSTPQLAFVDIDGDGDLDAVSGSYYGFFELYRNNQTNGVQVAVHVDVPTAPNQAPSGANSKQTIARGTSHVITAAEFGFTDPDGNAFSSVTISTVPGAGSRLLYQATAGGPYVAVTAGQVISIADIDAGKLSFRIQPGGTGPGSFTFQVHDDGGTAGGGVDIDPTPNTLTFRPPNEAPSGADSMQYLARGTSHVITASEFGFSDTDGNTFASVTISTVPGAGARLLYQATPGGAYTNVTVGQVISIADIDAGKLSFRLQPGGTGPGRFTFQVTDSGGTVAGGVNTDQSPNTMKFVAPNSAPSGTDASFVSTTGTAHIVTASDFGFSDIDGHAFASVTISSVPGAGARLLYQATPGGAYTNVTAGQVISIADIDAGKLSFRLQPGGSGTGNFTFQVHDTGGTGGGGVDTDQSPNTLTFNATAPTPAAVEGGQGDSPTSGVGDLSFAAVAVGTDSHLAGLKLAIDHVGTDAFILGPDAVINNWTVDIGTTVDQLSGHDLFARQDGGAVDQLLAINPEQLMKFSHFHTATDFAFA